MDVDEQLAGVFRSVMSVEATHYTVKILQLNVLEEIK